MITSGPGLTVGASGSSFKLNVAVQAAVKGKEREEDKKEREVSMYDNEAELVQMIASII